MRRKNEVARKITAKQAEKSLPSLCLEYLEARDNRDNWQKKMDEIKSLAYKMLDAIAGEGQPQIIAFEKDDKIYKFGRYAYGEVKEVDLAEAEKLLTRKQLEYVTDRVINKARWEQAVATGLIPEELANRLTREKPQSMRIIAKGLKGAEEKEDLAPVLNLWK